MSVCRHFRRWRYRRALITQGWDPERARFAAIIFAALDVHPSVVTGCRRPRRGDAAKLAGLLHRRSAA